MSYPVFCILSSASLIFIITCPSLSAVSAELKAEASGPEPNMVQGGGWAATYGGSGSDHASSIQQTRDGGYIVAGFTSYSDTGGKRIIDVRVLKLRPDGTVEWQKTYGGNGADRANSIHQTSDGGYVISGETEYFGAGAFDLWVLKLRPDGTVEWQKSYRRGDSDIARSVCETTDGGYIVAGETGILVEEVVRIADAWVLPVFLVKTPLSQPGLSV